MMVLQEKLKDVEVCEPVAVGPLQMFGLRWTCERPVAYRTLDEALAAGTLEVTEVSEGGSVPTLRVTNKGPDMVLMVAGEQLVGAKQNRVLNVSIMVSADSRLDVPVSCVEAGRWGYRSHKFHSKGSSSHSYLRAMMSKQASDSYKVTGKPSSNQGEVWREVDRKLRAMGSASASRELEAVYEDHRSRLEEVIAQAKLPADACGVVFAFGGRLAGLDLFDKPATLARLMPKLVRAYAVDALEETEETKPVSRTDAEGWLRSAAEATFERFDSPGVGTDMRIQGRVAAGAGLVVEDQPVHVELFPESEGGNQPTVARDGSRPAQAPVCESLAVVDSSPSVEQPASPNARRSDQEPVGSGWWARLRRAWGG